MSRWASLVSARSFDRLIDCKMQSEKYEVQNDELSSFCISYFAFITLNWTFANQVNPSFVVTCS